MLHVGAQLPPDERFTGRDIYASMSDLKGQRRHVAEDSRLSEHGEGEDEVLDLDRAGTRLLTSRSKIRENSRQSLNSKVKHIGIAHMHPRALVSTSSGRRLGKSSGLTLHIHKECRRRKQHMWGCNDRSKCGM